MIFQIVLYRRGIIAQLRTGSQRSDTARPVQDMVQALLAFLAAYRPGADPQIGYRVRKGRGLTVLIESLMRKFDSLKH